MGQYIREHVFRPRVVWSGGNTGRRGGDHARDHDGDSDLDNGPHGHIIPDRTSVSVSGMVGESTGVRSGDTGTLPSTMADAGDGDGGADMRARERFDVDPAGFLPDGGSDGGNRGES